MKLCIYGTFGKYLIDKGLKEIVILNSYENKGCVEHNNNIYDTTILKNTLFYEQYNELIGKFTKVDALFFTQYVNNNNISIDNGYIETFKNVLIQLSNNLNGNQIKIYVSMVTICDSLSQEKTLLQTFLKDDIINKLNNDTDINTDKIKLYLGPNLDLIKNFKECKHYDNFYTSYNKLYTPIGIEFYSKLLINSLYSPDHYFNIDDHICSKPEIYTKEEINNLKSSSDCKNNLNTYNPIPAKKSDNVIGIVFGSIIGSLILIIIIIKYICYKNITKKYDFMNKMCFKFNRISKIFKGKPTKKYL
jgi:hypothetical protein